MYQELTMLDFKCTSVIEYNGTKAPQFAKFKRNPNFEYLFSSTEKKELSALNGHLSNTEARGTEGGQILF